jgi:hypothetical protein
MVIGRSEAIFDRLTVNESDRISYTVLDKGRVKLVFIWAATKDRRYDL